MCLTDPLLGSSSQELAPGQQQCARPSANQCQTQWPCKDSQKSILSIRDLTQERGVEGLVLIYPPNPLIPSLYSPPHTHIPNPPGLSVLNPFSHGYQTEGVPRRPIITSFQNNSPSPLSLSRSLTLDLSAVADCLKFLRLHCLNLSQIPSEVSLVVIKAPKAVKE